MSNDGAYESNLEHIAEPDTPHGRETAVSTTIPDWVALWFAEQLRDYAHYEAEDPYGGIAIGLASYIDVVVRERGESRVALYTHTEEAVETVVDAVLYTDDDTEDPLQKALSAAYALDCAIIEEVTDSASVEFSSDSSDSVEEATDE